MLVAEVRLIFPSLCPPFRLSANHIQTAAPVGRHVVVGCIVARVTTPALVLVYAP